jgi:hypothetical protein
VTRAAVAPDGTNVGCASSAIRCRYLTPEALDGPIGAALAASDDVTLRFTPTTWHSWTAPSVDSPERLFLATER